MIWRLLLNDQSNISLSDLEERLDLYEAFKLTLWLDYHDTPYYQEPESGG